MLDMNPEGTAVTEKYREMDLDNPPMGDPVRRLRVWVELDQ
jgi:hypothetical protein